MKLKLLALTIILITPYIYANDPIDDEIDRLLYVKERMKPTQNQIHSKLYKVEPDTTQQDMAKELLDNPQVFSEDEKSELAHEILISAEPILEDSHQQTQIIPLHSFTAAFIVKMIHDSQLIPHSKELFNKIKPYLNRELREVKEGSIIFCEVFYDGVKTNIKWCSEKISDALLD